MQHTPKSEKLENLLTGQENENVREQERSSIRSNDDISSGYGQIGA